MSEVCEAVMPVCNPSTWSGTRAARHLAWDSPQPRQINRAVLVIDDKNGVRELLSLYLGGQGLDVATAHNAAEARAVIERGHFDLVILGWLAEVAEGPELLRLCKAGHRDIGVIIFTGSDLDQCGTEAVLGCGADAVVRRRGPLDALSHAVWQSLERRQARPLQAA
jgi:DNA-binding NtrC family response regulator